MPSAQNSAGSARITKIPRHHAAILNQKLERENIMKAFVLDRYGSKDGVRFGEMPDPELRDDDVLI